MYKNVFKIISHTKNMYIYNFNKVSSIKVLFSVKNTFYLQKKKKELTF